MVDDQCADKIQHGIDDLKHGKRLVEGARVLRLGHESEIRNVSDYRMQSVSGGCLRMTPELKWSVVGV